MATVKKTLAFLRHKLGWHVTSRLEGIPQSSRVSSDNNRPIECTYQIVAMHSCEHTKHRGLTIVNSSRNLTVTSRKPEVASWRASGKRTAYTKVYRSTSVFLPEPRVNKAQLASISDSLHRNLAVGFSGLASCSSTTELRAA